MESFEVVLLLLGCVLVSSIFDQVFSRLAMPLVQIALGAVVGFFIAEDPSAVISDPELFLLIFIFAKVGFSGSLVFYDSMLSDVTVPDRMDEVSSKGYAWGYIGSCVPFVVCLALVLGAGSIGISQMTALNLALFISFPSVSSSLTASMPMSSPSLS